MWWWRISRRGRSTKWVSTMRPCRPATRVLFCARFRVLAKTAHAEIGGRTIRLFRPASGINSVYRLLRPPAGSLRRGDQRYHGPPVCPDRDSVRAPVAREDGSRRVGRYLHAGRHILPAADLIEHMAAGMTPERRGNTHPGGVPFNVYQARDGYVSICAVSAQNWKSLLEP